jgi:hypothetical protein
MPQQNLSSKLGKSSSPIVDRVIQKNKDNQAVVNPATVTKSGQYNKQPEKV